MGGVPPPPTIITTTQVDGICGLLDRWGAGGGWHPVCPLLPAVLGSGRPDAAPGLWPAVHQVNAYCCCVVDVSLRSAVGCTPFRAGCRPRTRSGAHGLGRNACHAEEVLLPLVRLPTWLPALPYLPSTVCGRERLEINLRRWELEQQLALVDRGVPQWSDTAKTTRREGGRTEDLAGARVDVVAYVNGVPQTQLELVEGEALGWVAGLAGLAGWVQAWLPGWFVPG